MAQAPANAESDRGSGGLAAHLASHDLRYFGERRAAALEFSSEELSLARLDELLSGPDEMVRRVACEVVVRGHPAGAAELLLKHILQEPSPSLRRRMAVGLAGLPDRDDRLIRDRLTSPEVEADLRRAYGDYLLERTRQEVEALLHDGTVPGFYDGQFDAVYAIAPDMCEWLERIAIDADYNYVLRVMAIMGMHRGHDPRAERILRSLMVHPAEEIAVDMTLRPYQTEDDLLRRRRAQLSRYCRFSLAKAGNPAYVDEKILFLRLELERNRQVLARERGREEMSIRGELAAQLLFDIGYNHQQLDRYARSIEWYRKVIDGWPYSGAAVNAHYNLACIYAIQGMNSKALGHLEAAVQGGFTDFRWIVEDRDLAALRSEPRFEKLVGLVRAAERKAAAETENGRGPGKD